LPIEFSTIQATPVGHVPGMQVPVLPSYIGNIGEVQEHDAGMAAVAGFI